MKTLKYRAQIEKIEGNKIFYVVPQKIYESEIEDLDEARVCDPANLKRDFLEFSKSVYIGNKRRIRRKIAGLVPEEVRSIWDPMCGFSAVLKELALVGKKIYGNDLNLTAYYFSRALFLNDGPKEKEAKEFIDSVEEHDGFFAKSSYWPAAKIPKNYEKFIDGFVKKARESDRPSFYLGVAASYLSAVIGGFGGPYHPRAVGYFKIDALKNSLLGYAKELLSCEATGTITCKNALTMEIPDVDLIYFDPPYKEGNPTYFNRYAKANSILIQQDWKAPEEITQKQVAEFGKKLQDHTEILVVSTSPLSPVSWKQVLENSGREIFQKRFQMTGTGLGNAAENLNQRKLSELVWISTKKSLTEIVKAKDPFMIYPPEDQEYKYMQHAHFRGRSVHNDLRIEGLQKEYLLGWTLMTAQEGKIKEPVLTMQDAKKIVANSKEYFKIDFQTGEWAKRKKEGAKPGTTVNVSIVATRKASEPVAWADFSGITPKGKVGGTKEFPGVFIIIDKGIAEYLSNKSWMHEYFFDGKVLKRGRYLFRQLKAWKKTEKSEEEILEIIGGENVWEHIRELNRESFEILKDEGMTEKEVAEWIKPQIAEMVNELNLTEEEIEKAFILPPGKEEGIGKELGWLFIKPIDQTPYTLSLRAIKESWLPPQNFSALPKHWKKHTKSEEEYWKMSGQKALDARKAFRERLKKEGILKKAEEGNPDPFKMIAIKKEEDFLQADYRLTYQWWKGPKVVREGPSKAQYHIWLKTDKKILDFLVNDNILESSATGGILYKDRTESEMDSEGYVKPGTKLNPTKATPSFIKVLDKGEAIMLIDSLDLKKIQFKGAKMKGTFLFKNIESYWEIKRVQESSKEGVE